MHIMEEVLENETFAFYSLSQKNGYGRLEAASPKSQGMYSASVRLSEYTLAMDTLEKGQVWANRDFVKEMFLPDHIKSETDSYNIKSAARFLPPEYRSASPDCLLS